MEFTTFYNHFSYSISEISVICIDNMDSGIPEGFPDLMVLRSDGKACFVETKIHPRKPTKIQLQRQELLRSLGYRAGTAYTVDEAMEIIEKD